MKFEIKHRYSGEIIFSCDTESWKIAIILALQARADLRNTDLRNADLRNTDLRNTDLRNTDLRNADLTNADLRNTVLRNTDLRNTDLTNAVLTGADLRNTDLRNTVLTGADLRNTDLTGAVLTGAVLTGADLTGADLDFSSWPLHCGSFKAKVNDRLVWQLICHLTRLDISGCSIKVKLAIEKLDDYKNEFCEYRSDVTPI